MCITMNGLEYRTACICAGTGCGGHLVLGSTDITMPAFTPIGYQGPAQHTYTMACDGFHPPGPCPVRLQPYTVHI